MIFAHDDLHILDFYWLDHIVNALRYFKIVGLAGNKRRVPKQAGWMFLDEHLTRDSFENLSGVVGHGTGFPPQNLTVFGPAGQHVKLLDGLLLAAHSTTLIDNNLSFDETFDFHFYDMDICRQAEQKNLSCGTVPLSLVHESGGNFTSEAWKKSYATYLAKWGS
jgi:hypothetical protein